MRHIRQELRLVFVGLYQLARITLKIGSRFFERGIPISHHELPLFQQLGLFFQLLVGIKQLLLIVLQLAGLAFALGQHLLHAGP